MTDVCYIISLAIQKGGSTKTVSSINIASYFAMKGYKTLLIDNDSQANSTEVFFDPEPELSLKDCLMYRTLPSEVIQPTKIPNLQILPANITNSELEGYFGSLPEPMYSLRDFITDNNIRQSYDFIIIDNPPALGLTTLNALVASDFVLIPLNCRRFAARGMGSLFKSIGLVQKRANPDLEVLGAFINRYDPRASVIRAIYETIREQCKDILFTQTIRESPAIVEESLFAGLPVFMYAAKGAVSQDFAALAEEVLSKLRARIAERERTMTS